MLFRAQSEQNADNWAQMRTPEITTRVGEQGGGPDISFERGPNLRSETPQKGVNISVSQHKIYIYIYIYISISIYLSMERQLYQFFLFLSLSYHCLSLYIYIYLLCLSLSLPYLFALFSFLVNEMSNMNSFWGPRGGLRPGAKTFARWTSWCTFSVPQSCTDVVDASAKRLSI